MIKWNETKQYYEVISDNEASENAEPQNTFTLNKLKCEEYVRLDIDTYNKLFVENRDLLMANEKLTNDLTACKTELEMEQTLTSNVTNKLKDLLDKIVVEEPEILYNTIHNYEVSSPSIIAEYLTENYLDLIKEIKHIKD